MNANLPRLRFSLRTLFVVVTVGACSQQEPAEPTIAPGKVESTNAFARFKAIESIELESWFDGDTLVYQVPEAQWSNVAGLFAKGIRNPGLEKREAMAALKVRADGKSYRWSLLHISDAELMLFVESSECWRGIDRNAVAKYMRQHGTPEPATH